MRKKTKESIIFGEIIIFSGFIATLICYNIIKL